MSETQEASNTNLEGWLNAERWFMRYSGSASIAIGLISLIFGTFNNPENEAVIAAFNFSIAIIFVIAGIGMLWFSYNDKRMSAMLDGLLEQSANRPNLLAVMQIFTSIFFLLEGFRGRITLLLLGILLLTSAMWFFRRSMQIRKFQTVA